MKNGNLGLLASSALALALATGGAAVANDYPTETIRIIVPYGPGGATDLVARDIAEGLGRVLDQTVIVENMAGANGALAMQELANADPDGHTLYIGNVTTNMLHPLLEGDAMAVNAFEDFVPVTQIGTIPHVMVATTLNFPPETLSEVVDYARERPGELNHSSAGMLAYTHVDFLRLQERADIRMEMIPLQSGAGGGQTDLLTGDVQLAITNAATVLPFVEAGELKAIAVTSRERLDQLPEVETFTEAGFEGIGTSAWQAMFVSADVPIDIVEIIHEATLQVLEDSVTRENLESRYFDVEPQDSLEGAAEWYAAEQEAWRPGLEDALSVLDAR